MVKDFVENDIAYFACTECGAKDTILKYKIVPEYDFPIIDYELTNSGISCFVAKHSLCTKLTTQTKIEFYEQTQGENNNPKDKGDHR